METFIFVHNLKEINDIRLENQSLCKPLMKEEIRLADTKVSKFQNNSFFRIKFLKKSEVYYSISLPEPRRGHQVLLLL